MGIHRGGTVIDIKPLLHPVWDVGRKIDVEKRRPVSRLDPKTASGFLPRLREHIKVVVEQRPVWFNSHIVLIEGNKHR